MEVDERCVINKKEYTKNIVANLKDKISEFKNRKAHEKEERRNELDFEINKDLVNQFKKSNNNGNSCNLKGLSGSEESKGEEIISLKMKANKEDVMKEMRVEQQQQQDITVLPKKSKTNTMVTDQEKDKDFAPNSMNQMKSMFNQNYNEINKENIDEKK